MTARSKKTTHPKDNAKGRRKKENKELCDLASQLPLPVSAATQLDKASVIRLATAYLKLRRLFPYGLGKEWGEGSSIAGDALPELGKFLNKAFHGFVFILGADATILYISEEASAQLGFSQVQLTGKSFWNYVHSSDAKELKTLLCFDVDIPAFNVGNPIVEVVEVPRNFTVRMKCILPKRQAELAVDRYKVIHCRGYLKLKRKSKHWDCLSRVYYEMIGIVASGHSLSHTPSAEIKLYKGDFMFRTGLNLQFSYLDPRSQKITGYEPIQLQNKSLYKFIHPHDCKQMKLVHETAVTKSQAISSYYRFLTRNGGWIWIQSSCIIISSNKTDNCRCILFINSVLSDCEHPDYILAIEQVATEGSKQYYPSKRSRTCLKNRKKISSDSSDNSSPTDQYTINENTNQISKIEGLVEFPIYRTNDAYCNNCTSDFIQKTRMCESLQITNSSEIISNKYTQFSASFNTTLESNTNFSYLETMKNANTEQASNEFQACHNMINNSSPELDDSGIVFQNLIKDSSHVPSMLNLKDEQVTHHSTLISATKSDLVNYNFLNSYIPVKENETNQTSELVQGNQTISSPFTNYNHLLKLNSDFIINNDNFNSVLDKSSLNITEQNEILIVNSHNLESLKNAELVNTRESNISESLIFNNIKSYNILLDNNQQINNAHDFLSHEKDLLNQELTNSDSTNCNKDIINSSSIISFMSETGGTQTSDFKNCNFSNPVFSADLMQETVCNTFSNKMYTCCSSSSNQNFNDTEMNHIKSISQTEAFPINHDGITSNKEISPDENTDSLLTIYANPTAKTDYDQKFNKSLNLNNKTISVNDCWTPVQISTDEQPIINEDAGTTFYVLKNLRSDILSFTNYETNEAQNFTLSVADNIVSNDNSILLTTVKNSSSKISNCTSELCTSYSLNSDANSPVLISSSLVPIMNADQSGNFASHSSNSSSVSNVTQEIMNKSTNGYSNTNSEHLNDQSTAIYSQSAMNARSDSASSISLGYASESSYLEQSPFSTYGESFI